MEHNPTGLKIHPHVGKLLEINLKRTTPLLWQATTAVRAPSSLNAAGLGFIHIDIPTARNPGGAGCRTLPVTLQRPLPSDPATYGAMETRGLPTCMLGQHDPDTRPRGSREAALTVAAVEVVVAPGTVR